MMFMLSLNTLRTMLSLLVSVLTTASESFDISIGSRPDALLRIPGNAKQPSHLSKDEVEIGMGKSMKDELCLR